MNILKSIKDKGLDELKLFKNRVYKTRGMERISEKDFQKIVDKTDELIDVIKNIDEEDE